MGGVASAAMGTLYTVIAAIVSALSTYLQSIKLTPLALSYLLLLVFIFVCSRLRNSGVLLAAKDDIK